MLNSKIEKIPQILAGCKLKFYLYVFLLPACMQMSARSLAQFFQVKKNNGEIEVSENNHKILFYQYLPKSSKSLNGQYERAGYIHPLYNLNGKIITEDFPEDHPYHHGIFWAWHQVIINDKKIADGWVYDNLFFQPHKINVKNNKKNVIIKSEMYWKSVFRNHNAEPILKEKTLIKIYAKQKNYRVINFDIFLKPIVDNLKIGGSDDAKGYGGFCLRLKLPPDITFESDGQTVLPQENAVLAGKWMNFTGSFGDEKRRSGILIFNHSANPGQQNKWILRNSNSMQNVPYPGSIAVLLPKKGLRLQHIIIVHDGTMDNVQIRELYAEYCDN